MSVDCTGRIVDRTIKTEADYAKRAMQLFQQAKREDASVNNLADVVGWFCRQHARWAPSTVRQYRAALLYDLASDATPFGDRPTLSEALGAGPRAKDGGPKRTSSRKRKSLRIEEFTKLLEFFNQSIHADDKLILGFVALGAALFLRPIEYLSAEVIGTTIIVQNAKSTNGRANGVERERDLSTMPPGTLDNLKTFLVALKRALEHTGDWRRLRDRLAARLARVCKKLGIGRVSLYTLRHVGIATAKTWMTPIEVAASAGHGAVRTATSHYAKRRTGWIGLKLAGKPSAKSISRVRGEFRIFQPRTAGANLNPG